MFLEIQNVDNLDLDGFVEWIVNDIRKVYVSLPSRNQKLEETWEKYFSTTDFGWATDISEKSVVPTVNFILNQFFTHQIVEKTDSGYIITVDHDLKLNNTDITIERLAATINYGVLDCPPYPYFDAVYDYYAEQLQSLFDEWVLTKGKMPIYNGEDSQENGN